MYTAPVSPPAVDGCRIRLVFSKGWILLLVMLMPGLNSRSLDQGSDENNLDQINKVYTLNGVEEPVSQGNAQVYLVDNYENVFNDSDKNCTQKQVNFDPEIELDKFENLQNNRTTTSDYFPLESLENTFRSSPMTSEAIVSENFVTPSETTEYFAVETEKLDKHEETTSTAISELENLTITTNSYPETQTNSSSPTLEYEHQLRRYDGAQIWRIVVENERERRLAEELQTKFGTILALNYVFY